jgi:hypothetical protein
MRGEEAEPVAGIEARTMPNVVKIRGFFLTAIKKMIYG